MNNKGQALVEFVLILPLFLMLLFVIVDFGVIFNAKSSLENISVDITGMLKNNEDIENIRKLYNDIDIEVITEGNYTTIKLSEKVDLITPGLNRVLSDPYDIEVKRVISNV